MNFHLGKPILVMLAISLISGIAVSLRPPQRKADITVWIFADSHYQAFKPLVEKFEKANNCTVNLNLLHGRALAVRLGQLFMADPTSEGIPDLVELEIGLVGRFFRPPLEEIGFLPLNDRLERDGLREQIVETRFAPWTKKGVIFGVPHDVHPCTITYREDLFREAGVDLAAAATWPQFHAACEQFKTYWRAKGFRYRHAMELPEGSTDYFQVMLLQRGINPIDNEGNVNLQDPRVAQTLAFYTKMIAGPRKVTAQTSAGSIALTKDLLEGSLCAFITPDWRVSYIKTHGEAVAGKMRMMPMPVFDPTDKPTSTLGGTMMGITKACKNPDLAWKLLHYLYFSDEGLRERVAASGILPPVKTLWSHPVFHDPDPFFGGQKALELFTQLADEIPPRHVTPATTIATLALNDALIDAIAHMNRHGEAGLEEACRKTLAQIDQQLRSRMRQMRFDQ